MNFNAGDNSKVGGQFGVVNGSVHIYDIGASATPSERFAKALNLLEGNMPRRAEELIREAVEGGYCSHEVTYYWALSVLSGRSFDHLGQEQFTSLQNCSALVDPVKRDGWLEALNVITQFINCLVQQERFGGLDDQQLDQIILEYGGLAEKRREEIRRHLDLIMTGALQDRLDAKYAAEVKERRMTGDRMERAWKFFQPEPCPPITVTLTEPHLSATRRATAVTGATVSGAALLAGFCVVLPSQPVLALLFAAALGVGSYLLATKGRSWLVRRERIAADAARHAEPTVATRYSMAPLRPETDGDEPRVWGESDEADEKHIRELNRLKFFRSFVGPWVDVRFADEDPDGANKRKEWKEDTDGLRRSLTGHVRRQYAHPDRRVGEVDWLITWHAKRAKERWEKGTLRAKRDELRAAGPGGFLPALGGAAVVAGLICGAIGMVIWSPGFGVLLLVIAGAGGAVARGSKADVYAVQHDVYLAESALAAAEQDEEQAAFDRWTEDLEDRPSDAEMARWLDYDKFYVKNMVMNTWGLANRDVIAHAILTEAAYPCRRARVLFGPPRYSKYRVVVFLLTEGGVWQASLDLDFLDGTVGNQKSTTFRYDAISSARVIEVGVRFDSGRRSVILLEDQTDDKEPLKDQKDATDLKDLDALILSQAFRLSFMDGKHMDVVVDNFDHGFLDRLREDIETLKELTLDSSGVKGALRVLQSIAAEGREWLGHERSRRNRRLLDFSKTLAGRRELPWHVGDPQFPELES